MYRLRIVHHRDREDDTHSPSLGRSRTYLPGHRRQRLVTGTARRSPTRFASCTSRRVRWDPHACEHTHTDCITPLSRHAHHSHASARSWSSTGPGYLGLGAHVLPQMLVRVPSRLLPVGQVHAFTRIDPRLAFAHELHCTDTHTPYTWSHREPSQVHGTGLRVTHTHCMRTTRWLRGQTRSLQQCYEYTHVRR